MEFSHLPEQAAAVDGLRRFLDAEVRPLLAGHFDQPAPKDVVVTLLRKLSSFGLGSGWTPESSGGQEIDLLTSGLLYEQLARVSSGFAASVCVNDSVAMVLHHLGTAQQKQRYLPGLLAGELVASIAVTEPDVGSNPSAVRTRATRRGERITINGEKTWITNGHVSDVVLLVCRLDGELSLVLVDRASGYVSRDLPKLGQKESSSAQMFFDEVEVPAKSLVGQPGTAMRETARLFERARCMVGMYAVGIAGAALDHAIEYAKGRMQWGKPIGAHQLVQGMLAEMATDVECSRLLSLQALDYVARGERREDAAAMAKWYASEAAVRVASNAIQIHGAYGLSCEYPVERLMRDARMLTIPDGTTQMQKLIIGRKLTGLSAFA